MPVHEFHIFINGVERTTHEHELLPEEILRIGGFTSSEYKLMKVNAPNVELVPGTSVQMEDGEKFLALKKSNPFSDINGIPEIEKFIIEKLGLKSEHIQGSNGENLVAKDFVVPAGCLAGKICDIAIACTNSAPFNPHPYFHVRPALVSNGSANGTQAGQITADWQYWSRRWVTPPKSPEEVWAWVLTALTEAA